MPNAELPSPEVLRQLLRYDPDTGKMFWLKRGAHWFSIGVDSSDHNMNKWNSKNSGKEAFTSLCSDGYFRGSIFSRKMLAQRVIWAIYAGSWPENDIDHINGDRSDNRISNLREATRSENLFNQGPKRENTSGYKGAYFDNRRGAWYSEIKANGVKRYLGRFSSPEDAHGAYCRAAKKYHGKFARTE